jgi:hypothetical protein
MMPSVCEKVIAIQYNASTLGVVTVFTEMVPSNQYQRPSTASRQTSNSVEPPV